MRENTEILLSVNLFMKLRRLLNPFKPRLMLQRINCPKQDSLDNIKCVYIYTMHLHQTKIKKKKKLFKQYT